MIQRIFGSQPVHQAQHIQDMPLVVECVLRQIPNDLVQNGLGILGDLIHAGNEVSDPGLGLLVVIHLLFWRNPN